jgi:hypothetical protein
MQIRASLVFYIENYIKHINALCVQNSEFMNAIVAGTYYDMAPENRYNLNRKPVLPFMLENATEQWVTCNNTNVALLQC